MRRISLVTLLALGCAAFAQAQTTLLMGNTVASPNSNDLDLAAVRTDVDLGRPANASGPVELATFSWSTFPCPAAVKIKFFRRHAGTLNFLAERGPFDVTAAETTVDLIPSVTVEQGDLVGITRLTDCGNPQTLTGIVNPGYLAYAGDVTTNVSVGDGENGGGVLAVSANGVALEVIYSVLAAAGSTPGANDSFFRTGLQLANPSFGDTNGRLVYHPAGVSGSSGDPSLPFTIGARSTIAFNDVVQTMGQSGLGSIDVVIPYLAAIPLAIARVYNDAGVDGTSGFTEEAIPLENDNHVIVAGGTGILVGPADLTRFRYNIGVRTLLAGARLTFRVRDANGTTVRTVDLEYDPTFFTQQPAETLLGGPLPDNAMIEVSVSTGSAIVYGATVDNVTNDPSIQFARIIFIIA